jgi:chitodextrinase
MNTRFNYLRPRKRSITGLLAVLGLALAILLPLSEAAAATPAFVQARANEVNSGTTNSAAFNSANTAGNLIVAYVVWNNAGAVNLGDSKGNVYTAATTRSTFGSNWSTQVFYAKNVSGGTNTVTATFATSISSFGILYVHEYSGIDKVNPVDVTKSATGTGSAMSSGPAATTNANDLLFGAGASGKAVTANGSGYTSRSSAYGNRTEDRAVTATGSYTATATQNGSAWSMQLVAFKADSGVADISAPSVPTGLAVTAASLSQINVNWTASTDNVGVAGYKVYRNGTQVGTAVGTSYQDAGLSPGTAYSYTVSAYDATGNTSAQSVSAGTTTLADTTAPAVNVTSPANGATLAGATTIVAAATDNVGVTKVEFLVDGQLQGTDTTSPYSFALDTTTLSDGAHVIVAKAYDAVGNVTTSAPVNVTIANTPISDTSAPSMPAGLSASATSTSQINVNWTAATDNVAVTGYKVYRNGTQVGVVANTSYQDVDLTASTTYSYTVAAYDAAGNVSAQSLAAGATTYTPSVFSWPASVSANHRYLIDQNGQPYMIVGDSPHSIAVNLTPTQMETYFANRQARGFNAAWVEAISNPYTSGRTDATTYDGIAPFTTPGNLTTPNEAYFQRLDTVIQTAKAHGVTVFLTPIDEAGWIDTLRANTEAQNYAYGTYLGNRYKNYPNVVWELGNDFQTWDVAGDDARIHQIAQGIKDAGAHQLQTIELNYQRSGSVDDASWASVINLDAAYTYFPTYDQVLKDYNRANVPVFMVEANYEDENLNPTDYPTTNETLRRQEYWTMLSGATGQLYGNHATWTFPADWQNHLNTTAVSELGYMKDMLASRPWYNLVPDQSHSFLTAGYGTYSTANVDVLANDYATAAVTSDRGLGLVYTPTARTLTVDMSKLGGSVTARWFDPVANSYTLINGSPFTNSGTMQFVAPSGTHADGTSDWILVLEASVTPDTQAPSVPGGLTATPVSTTRINVSWTASTDNVAATGYHVFRNGVLVATMGNTSYQDTSLTASTAYTYTVTAYDLAGNESAQSSAANVTTLATDPSPTVAPTFVQEKDTLASSGATTTTTFTSANTTGNLIVVYVVWGNTSPITLSDSRGNAYIAATSRVSFGSSNQWSAQVFYAKNIASGANTITTAYGAGASPFALVYAHEYAGVDQANPVDVVSAATGTGSTMSSGAVTTTSTNDLLFGAGASDNNVTNPGANFTVRSTAYGNITEDRTAATTGTYNATATHSGSAWSMLLVAFKAAQ